MGQIIHHQLLKTRTEVLQAQIGICVSSRLTVFFFFISKDVHELIKDCSNDKAADFLFMLTVDNLVLDYCFNLYRTEKTIDKSFVVFTSVVIIFSPLSFLDSKRNC